MKYFEVFLNILSVCLEWVVLQFQENTAVMYSYRPFTSVHVSFTFAAMPLYVIRFYFFIFFNVYVFFVFL